jgi:hypothetical protein
MVNAESMNHQRALGFKETCPHNSAFVPVARLDDIQYAIDQPGTGLEEELLCAAAK